MSAAVRMATSLRPAVTLLLALLRVPHAYRQVGGCCRRRRSGLRKSEARGTLAAPAASLALNGSARPAGPVLTSPRVSSSLDLDKAARRPPRDPVAGIPAPGRHEHVPLCLASRCGASRYAGMLAVSRDLARAADASQFPVLHQNNSGAGRLGSFLGGWRFDLRRRCGSTRQPAGTGRERSSGWRRTIPRALRGVSWAAGTGRNGVQPSADSHCPARF